MIAHVKSTLVVTAAGKSMRFPDDPPKWSLTHPGGSIMLSEAIRRMTPSDRTIICLNNTDSRRFDHDAIAYEVGRPCEIINVGSTSSQVETVLRAVKSASVEGALIVRDCDSTFDIFDYRGGNVVAVVDLQYCGRVDAGNKSYIMTPGGSHVTGMVEKRVVSRFFGCGVYCFNDVGTFLAHEANNTYMSGVVNDAIQKSGEEFSYICVTGYEDWGTAGDWRSYRSRFATVFVDIDGVLVSSGHRSFSPRWGTAPALKRNIERLNGLYSLGRIYIVLVTSRDESARETTMEEMRRHGVKYHQLVMGLPACSRVLVNDVVLSRQEETAVALNIARNSDGSLDRLARMVAR